MKNLIKISLTTLGTIAILGTSVMALTGTVNSSSGLVLRKAADRNGEPITTVPSQTEVNIIEKSGEWYKVTYNSQEGYLFAEYVNATETPQETTSTPTEASTETPTQAEVNNQVSNRVKVYNIPLITSTVINEIPENTEIIVKKQITNWSYVSAGEIQGWVRTSTINGKTNTVEPETQQQPAEIENENNETPEETTPVAAEPEDTEPEATTTATTGTINVDYANLREKASTTSEVLTTLTKSTTVNIENETDGWYKINYTASDGTIYNGYISKSLVTER